MCDQYPQLQMNVFIYTVYLANLARLLRKPLCGGGPPRLTLPPLSRLTSTNASAGKEHVIYLIITECVFIVCGKFPSSSIKKTVRVTGLVFSVKCRYNPDEAKW